MAARFEVIKKHITSKIEQGLWAPGAPVPSENALAEQFSVSRMTARRALTELTEAGVLMRSQGLGTFVANQLPTGSLLEIRSIAEEIDERGHEHRCEVLALDTVIADTYIAAQLGVEEGCEVFFSRIRHFEVDSNGQSTAIQVEERFVLPSVAPEYLKQNFQQQIPSDYLKSIIPLTEADHWVEAVLPDSTMQTWLDISNNTPCLKLTRRTFGQKQGIRSKTPVNYACLYHPGDRYRLGGHLEWN